jgi:RND family efflux transporter MFP subunit
MSAGASFRNVPALGDRDVFARMEMVLGCPRGSSGKRRRVTTLKQGARYCRPVLRLLAGVFVLCVLCGCGKDEGKSADAPVRGLRAYKVAANTESRVRRFPSVLQPADISRLSFEIAGQLMAVTLNTGQKIKLGDVLMEIDPRSVQTQLDEARARVKEAEAVVANASADLSRKTQLLERGFATRAAFDQSQASLLTARAQLDQAQRQTDLAAHNLQRSKLIAPFSGTIAGVEVKSFGQVATGQTVLTLYSDDSFELAFSVPTFTFQALQVGQPVKVTVTDRPELSLTAVIKELGAKAEQVSAFPVIVRLKNDVPGLNAGMAAEVSLELPLASGGGYLVPLSVLVPEGGKDLNGVASVFVYDGASTTVRKRRIAVGGIRDNQLAVTEGLQLGDLVASAGVSYLTDGQKVRLLPVKE